MIKEHVLFINANFAFSLDQKRAVTAEDLAHKKVYGIFFSSFTEYKLFNNADEKIIKEEINREYKEQQSQNVVYRIVNIENEQHVYIEQKDLVKSVIDNYNVYSLSYIMQIFNQAVNKFHYDMENKTVIIGILNIVNNTLIYNIYKNNKLYKSLTGLMPVSELLFLKESQGNDKILRDTLNTIEGTEKVKIDDYIIYGYNKPYDDLIRILETIRFKDTFNKEFQSDKTETIKKAILLVTVIFLFYPFLFLFSYVRDDIINSYQQGQVNKANMILRQLADNKRQLYKAKGKTIILENEIDFSKLSGILYPISQTYPNTIDYTTDKSMLKVTLLYADTIMAYNLHKDLSASHVNNTFSIAPNTEMAQVVINLPLNSVTRGY